MPGGGGEVRSYFLAQAAAKLFDITLVSLGGSNAEYRVSDELTSTCSQVIQPLSNESTPRDTQVTGRFAAWQRTLQALVLPWKNDWQNYLSLLMQYGLPGTSTPKMLLRTVVRSELQLLSSATHMPPINCLLFNGAWKKVSTIAEAVARKPFDVVWVENVLVWPYAAKLLNIIPNARPFVVCSGHNLEHQVFERQAETACDNASRWFYKQQAKLMKRMEVTAWQSSSLILQCSESDASTTRQIVPKKPVIVVPNGVDEDYFTKSTSSQRAPLPQLVFTAGFGYYPNLEGLRWFLHQIFPLVRQARPDVRFVFAGAGAAEAAKALGQLPEGVSFLSDPPDIRPVFESGHVFVVPLLSGGGSRLKILEAISMQVPVVSTTLGAEGIPYSHGQHLLLADQPTVFAEHVLQLLSQPSLAKHLTQNATDFIRNRFTWKTISNKAQTEIQQALAKVSQLE